MELYDWLEEYKSTPAYEMGDISTELKKAGGKEQKALKAIGEIFSESKNWGRGMRKAVKENEAGYWPAIR